VTVQFEWPFALLLLVAVQLLALWLVRSSRTRPALGVARVDETLSERKTWRVRLRWLPAVLRLGAVALLIVAIARPQHGRAENLLPQEGIDIVLVLDTSTSMRQATVAGESRLSVAQRVLQDFVLERETDRLGLVVFRSRSLVLSPLTVDYSAFQTLLGQADDVNLPNGTAIGLALTDAMNLLQESRAESRTIILLSDGENNRPEVEPADAARIARTLGIRIYTISVVSGSATGTQLPQFQENEDALRLMADLSGGRHYQADPDSLADAYDDIDALERSRLGPERFSSVDELAPYALGLALALIAVEVLLATVLLRRMP
jgi:Ca-activated chloride channel family protein